MTKIKDVVLAARTKKGMSQRDLETKSTVHKATISRLEQGKIVDPPFFMILKIARALGISLEVFRGVEIESRFSDAARKKASMRIKKMWRENGDEIAAAIGATQKKNYKKTGRLTGIALMAHENNLASK